MDIYGNMTRKKACYFLGIRENASEEQIKHAYRYKVKLYHPDANPNADTKEYYLNVQKAYEYLMNHPADKEKSLNTNKNAGKKTGTNPLNSGAAMYYGYGNKNGRGMQNNAPFGYSGMYMNGQMNNPFFQSPPNARPAKVFASTASTRASYQRQKDKEKEREKLQKWDEEYKSTKKREQQEKRYGKEYADKMSGPSKSREEEALEKIRAIWLAETIRRQIALDQEHKEAIHRRKLFKAFMQRKIREEDS